MFACIGGLLIILQHIPQSNALIQVEKDDNFPVFQCIRIVFSSPHTDYLRTLLWNQNIVNVKEFLTNLATDKKGSRKKYIRFIVCYIWSVYSMIQMIQEDKKAWIHGS